MKTRKLPAAFLLMTTLSVAGTSAHAALIEWTFTATARDISGNVEAMADYGVTTGTGLSVTFLLDDSVPASPLSGNVWYDEAIVGVEINAGTFRASLDTLAPGFNSIVLTDGSFDAVSVNAPLIFENGSSSTTGFIATQFEGSDGQLLDNTLFPSFPDFSHADPYGGGVVGGTFMLLSASLDGVYTEVRAEIISPSARVVPVPAAAYLFGSALLALVRIGRRD